MTKIIKKLRYKFMYYLIKKIIPSFYNNFINLNLRVKNLPRPAIKIMTKLFHNNKVIGVEIGVAKGLNAKNIFDNLNIDKLYLIDIWNDIFLRSTLILENKDNLKIEKTYCFNPYFINNNSNNYKQALKLFKNYKNVFFIKDYSINAVKKFKNNSLDFVYIDGSHNYNDVFMDISLWFKKVKNNGIIAGHDSYLIDVLQAIIDFSISNQQLLKIIFPDWYIIKKV